MKNFVYVLIIVSTQMFGQDFTKDQLIGKGNNLLVEENSFLHPEAYESFNKMKEAARMEGIEIKLVSGYRNFDRQKSIWEGKYKRYTSQGLSSERAIEKIIEYSTIPGTSRHHWGTDVDIVDGNKKVTGDVLVPRKFHGNGPYCELKDWLDKNANAFGFYLVYTDNANRKGFKYEPWHYSYAPVSKKMLKEYKKLNIKDILLEEKLQGVDFFSNEFLEDYIKNNILDINPSLL